MRKPIRLKIINEEARRIRTIRTIREQLNKSQPLIGASNVSAALDPKTATKLLFEMFAVKPKV
jgi:hypothetical protein